MMYEMKTSQLHGEHRDSTSSCNVSFLMSFGGDPWAQLLYSCVAPSSLPNPKHQSPHILLLPEKHSHPSLVVNFFHHRHFSTSTPWQPAIVVTPCNYSYQARYIAKSGDKSLEFYEIIVTTVSKASERERAAGVQALEGLQTLFFNMTPTSVIQVEL